jgi:hypothetical protein
MAPKHHPTPLSGGDRKALNKELGKTRDVNRPYVRGGALQTLTAFTRFSASRQESSSRSDRIPW